MVLAMALDNLPVVDVPVIQNNVSPSLGEVLGDIESRMPRGHIYQFPDDLITWAHETTHGLNSKIRNDNRPPGIKTNAFYLLDGKGLVMIEPPGLRLSDVAPLIPRNLRGRIYQLYMIDQQRWWNNEPLYMWDEWVAYMNGTFTRTDLGIESRAETVEYMWEMAVYGSYVAMQAANSTINEAMKYLLDKTNVAYMSSKGTERADRYLSEIKSTNALIDFWASVGFRFLENV